MLKHKGIATLALVGLTAAALSASAFAATSAQTAKITADQMDAILPYVESYLSGSDTMLASTHAEFGMTCVSCHTLDVEGEDGATETKTLVDAGTRESCMRSGCHTNWESIVEATSTRTGTVTVYNLQGLYNPHDNHRGDADCGTCHKAHETSRLICVECHNTQVPEGWIGYI